MFLQIYWICSYMLHCFFSWLPDRRWEDKLRSEEGNKVEIKKNKVVSMNCTRAANSDFFRRKPFNQSLVSAVKWLFLTFTLFWELNRDEKQKHVSLLMVFKVDIITAFLQKQEQDWSACFILISFIRRQSRTKKTFHFKNQISSNLWTLN